ncbi:cofactor assembly, complex C [Actinidia rufa]|uniref:Cofactor assembly, complex C n=1 Tax=Actinidia rufa TaxID=165716 RepID=A0A7J0DFM2_9ERIC|nr:cofactor assembly, complex C [Actinidia rufa]
MQSLVPLDLDPATAKLVIGFLAPLLSALGFLFIVRVVISWYPKLPVEKFPYVVAFAPTEPLLVPTWKLIPPPVRVDATPVVWFGLISFMNEILVGPQRAACSSVSTSLAAMLCCAMRTLKPADLHFLERVCSVFGILYLSGF